MSAMMSTDVFYEMPEKEELYESQYDVKAGRWPGDYNECVLVLTSSGSMSDYLLYTMGLSDQLELDEMVRQFINEENVDAPEISGDYSYDDILGITFRLVDSADYYEYDSQYHVWKDRSGDGDYMRQLVKKGEELTIVGIVQPSKDANASALIARDLLSGVSDKTCGGAGGAGRDRAAAARRAVCQCVYRGALRGGQRRER